MTLYYAYCHKDGVATGNAGRETVLRTGAFEANENNYADVDTAIAQMTGIGASDTVKFLGASDSDTLSYSTSVLLLGASGDNPRWEIISVDVTAQDEYLEGYGEGTINAGDDIYFSGLWATFSDNLTTQDNIGMNFSVASNSHLSSYGGKWTFTGTGDQVDLAQDGCSITIVDKILDFVVTNATSGISIGNASKFEMIGGSVISSSTGTIPNLIVGSAGSGGLVSRITGTDLKSVTTNLAANVGGAIGDDLIDIKFSKCPLRAGVSMLEEPFIYPNHKMLVSECSSVSATVEHQFFYTTYAGDVEDNKDIYRNESDVWPVSGNRVSLKIITSARASRATPFAFQIPTDWIELSDATKDILRFYLHSANTLNNAQFWIEAHYPKTANPNEFIGQSSALQIGTSYTIDPLGTGATLTIDSTSTYTGGLANKYQVDIDTAGAGADGVPEIWVYVAVPSETIYLDSIFDGLA